MRTQGEEQRKQKGSEYAHHLVRNETWGAGPEDQRQQPLPSATPAQVSAETGASRLWLQCPSPATSRRRPLQCRHLCAPSFWPWAWCWLEPSTPMTPTPAASGKGEKGPCCALRAPSPCSPFEGSSALTSLPLSSIHLPPISDSALSTPCHGLPLTLPISDLVSISIPALTLSVFSVSQPLGLSGSLQDRAQSGSHFLSVGQAEGPAQGEQRGQGWETS